MFLIAFFLAATLKADPWDGTIRYRLGDDPSWASPAFDDSSWTAGKFDTLPLHANDALWIRFKLDLTTFRVTAGASVRDLPRRSRLA
jgi:hypothetical protein